MSEEFGVASNFVTKDGTVANEGGLNVIETLEELKAANGAQVEADMIAEAKKRAEDPAEQAAMVFTHYKANFERALAKIKGKGHTRLLNALVMSPLVEIKLLTEAEKEAFFFGDSMIQAKFVMMMSTYRDSAQEIIDLANSAKTEFIYENTENKTDVDL